LKQLRPFATAQFYLGGDWWNPATKLLKTTVTEPYTTSFLHELTGLNRLVRDLRFIKAEEEGGLR